MDEPRSLSALSPRLHFHLDTLLPIRRLARALPWWVLVAATTCFRLPELENASAVNSDVSIVGLQAMHMLRGQWSPLLEGSPYQTSTDAAVAAAYFALFGPSSLVLMISALIGHILLVWLVYSMLARHVGNTRAAIVCSLLAFTTCVVQIYALHPPRQTALTLAFLSAWICSADHRIPSSHLRLGLSAFVLGLAVFADPYGVVFVGPLMAYAASSVLAAESSMQRRREIGIVYLGALAMGLLPLVLFWAHQGGPPAQVAASFAGLGTRTRLLWSTCLPIVLGFRVPAQGAPVVNGSFALHAACALAMFAAFVSACAAPFLAVSGPIRRLALLAVATCVATLLGFLLSPCAIDQNSHRYLVGVSLMVPFLLAPAACVLDRKWLALIVLPIALSFSTAGWRAYGPRVRGLRVQPQAAMLENDERRVETYLLDHGVHDAVANYWEAYTMTFLYREEVEVVPREPWLDRAPAARARVMGTDKIGYIVNRGFPWDSTAMTDFWLKPLGSVVDRADVGRYTVLVLKRPSQPVAQSGVTRARTSAPQL